MSDIKRILHPTDFSENSRDAFQTACRLAREEHAALVVLHVILPNASPLAQAGALEWDDDGTVRVPDPRQPAESEQALAQLPWPRPADSQVATEYRLAEGDPAEEILRLTEELRCNLIVMGSHGKTGLARLLTGSVAEEVLRKAVRPVLIVKTAVGSKTDTSEQAAAKPGELVDVRPLGNSLASARTRTLVRSNSVQVVRLIVRAGDDMPQQRSKGEVIVHCLEGRVTVTALGKTQALEAGWLLELPAGEPHELTGIDDASSILLTTFVPAS